MYPKIKININPKWLIYIVHLLFALHYINNR